MPQFVCTTRRTIPIALILSCAASAAAWCQAPRIDEQTTARALAPIDLTGYWVSVVNEDWRWRMVTPPKGDFASVPLNEEGQKLVQDWDPSSDGSCLAYGVGGLMRMPMRLHIEWQDEQTLRIETDAGSQVRTLNFVPGDPGRRSLQGYSLARWVRTDIENDSNLAFRDEAEEPPAGYLRVETSNATGGWLRRNGVPYSEDAEITEYFDRFMTPHGEEWLTVMTIVDDPTYLTEPFVTSTQFRQEPDASKWMRTACR